MHGCEKHYLEAATGSCGTCGGRFCDDCLVPLRGSRLCVSCALSAAGVRTHSHRRRRVSGVAGRVEVGIVAAAVGTATIVPFVLTHLH